MASRTSRHLLPPLPALVFGNERAQTDHSALAMSERLGSGLNWTVNYEALGSNASFVHRAARMETGSLKLVASSCTPSRITLRSAERPSVLIPYAGRCVSQLDDGPLRWSSGENAALIPACPRGGDTTTRSVLLIDFDPARLTRTAATMHGLPAPDRESVLLDHARQLLLAQAGLRFDHIIAGLARELDASGVHPAQPAAIELEDRIYRALAMMTGLVPSSDAPDRHSPTARLDAVCDHILSHMNEPIELTELERIAGVSRRMLQYAFRRRFGCSPLAWTKRQRLHAARQRLAALEENTVTALALELGFPSPSRFAAAYLAEFGEMPSTTRRRRH